ncbi:hypothetical protein FOLKNPGA_00785 [Legionella sp. PC1000]|uniref:Uncharacterized protein n=2 Tax=Legionella TaxID=445 RepID=A0A0W0SEE2_9GAMM|nr:hypothetical protein Lbru_1789 [Legionella brunensis]KTD62902.1 hypothetical protein Lsan_1562 [Legionella santicrucis]QLZ68007.1 hypothetical protein FOLKNPGA_00785 [Legionella sp. PC1000]
MGCDIHIEIDIYQKGNWAGNPPKLPDFLESHRLFNSFFSSLSRYHVSLFSGAYKIQSLLCPSRQSFDGT